MVHSITILHVEGCGGAAEVARVAHALATARGDLLIEQILIEDEAQGQALGFRGSPTVLVDGADIEAEPQAPVGSMG